MEPCEPWVSEKFSHEPSDNLLSQSGSLPNMVYVIENLPVGKIPITQREYGCEQADRSAPVTYFATEHHME